MASNTKADARRKSAGSAAPVTTTSSADSLIVTLKFTNPDQLADALGVDSPSSQENKSPAKVSPAPSTAAAAAAAVLPPLAPSNTDANSDSNPATPAAGTPAGSTMGPPGDKKAGVKRVRAKPGPKKKQRLDDGEILRPAGVHKLGPKASMGAINAGLRALDRTGKPCKRWAKGGFRLKTFTGVIWEIPCWKTKNGALGNSTNSDSAAASTESSVKDNKDSNKGETSSANGTNGVDVEMGGTQETAPAPVAIAAAS